MAKLADIGSSGRSCAAKCPTGRSASKIAHAACGTFARGTATMTASGGTDSVTTGTKPVASAMPGTRTLNWQTERTNVNAHSATRSKRTSGTRSKPKKHNTSCFSALQASATAGTRVPARRRRYDRYYKRPSKTQTSARPAVRSAALSASDAVSSSTMECMRHFVPLTMPACMEMFSKITPGAPSTK